MNKRNSIFFCVCLSVKVFDTRCLGALTELVRTVWWYFLFVLLMCRSSFIPNSFTLPADQFSILMVVHLLMILLSLSLLLLIWRFLTDFESMAVLASFFNRKTSGNSIVNFPLQNMPTPFLQSKLKIWKCKLTLTRRMVPWYVETVTNLYTLHKCAFWECECSF